jgi:hypothetical protein
MNYCSINYSTLVVACLPDLETKSSFRTRVQNFIYFDTAVESWQLPKKKNWSETNAYGWTRAGGHAFLPRDPQGAVLSSVCPTSCGVFLAHIGLVPVPIDSNIVLECNAGGVYLQRRIEKASSTTVG